MNSEFNCKRCGYRWKPRISNPKCCPQCMSRSWNSESYRDRPIVLTQKSVKNNPQIRTDRETLKSLPLWYQALAEVLKEKGRLILTDEVSK